jgi:hypothetical protein
MRASALLQRLPHTADAERRLRYTRWHGRRRSKRAAAAHTAVPHTAATATTTSVSRHDLATDQRSTGSLIVQRVRNAGGPIDNASYTCACGFVFAASVSTTVACPHCGASQAW